MKATRKTARQRLKQATKAEFENLIETANLTPMQSHIVKLHILQEQTISKIAMALSFCESSVRNILSAAYDKIAKL